MEMDIHSSNKTNNKLINENEIKVFEKSFDRLVNLQVLLKKESSLKELCKILLLYFFIVIKTREDTSKIIHGLCKDIYTKKLEVNNLIAEKEELDNRKFKLISELEEQHNYFKDIYTYIPKFFVFLWEDPKIISKLLITNIEDIKKNLAPFFVNNFYENILSSKYIEDNLIYLISLILFEEIKDLRKENYNIFLEETVGGYILEQFKRKIDIQNYFKEIIFSSIEKLEAVSSFKKINFNVKKIQEDFTFEKN